MKAVVVYEFLWGNTAAIAKAVAEGFGQGTQALATDQAVGNILNDVDLIIACVSVLGFNLPDERMRSGIAMGPLPARST